VVAPAGVGEVSAGEPFDTLVVVAVCGSLGEPVGVVGEGVAVLAGFVGVAVEAELAEEIAQTAHHGDGDGGELIFIVIVFIFIFIFIFLIKFRVGPKIARLDHIEKPFGPEGSPGVVCDDGEGSLGGDAADECDLVAGV